MTPLLAQFITETRDQIEQIGNGLLAIERNPDDLNCINDVFRCAHTIKGSSGLFEFPAITRLVHAAEDLLDSLRNHEIAFDSAMTDLLLSAFDHVTQWIDDLERHEHLEPASEEFARLFAAKLRAFLPNAENAAEINTTETEIFDLSWLIAISEVDRLTIFDQLSINNTQLVLFQYQPDEQCFFTGDDPFFLVRQVDGLAALHIEAITPWSTLAELDAYRSVLRFSGIVIAPLAVVKEHFRYVADQIKIATAMPIVLALPTGELNGGPVYDDFVRDAQAFFTRQDWTGLRRIAATLLEVTNPDLWAASALRWLLRLLSVPTPPDAAAIEQLLIALPNRSGPDWTNWQQQTALVTTTTNFPPVTAVAIMERAPTAEEQAVFINFIRQQLRILSLPVDAELWLGKIEAIRNSLCNALLFIGRKNDLENAEEVCALSLETRATDTLRNFLEKLLPADTAPNAVPETPTIKQPEEPSGERDKSAKILKVDQHKIDQLMDLIGELIVAKNGLPYLAQRAERIFGVRELAREIKDQYAVIHRIAQALQGSIMQVRMMPVANIFQRFPRLVRDLSRKLDKQIKLIIEGEDTEADKNIIEALADPLIHILRNSLDHGIEPPEERLTSGKPAEGTIRVIARQDNENVIIEVIDDGRGIDGSAVLRKAVAHGIINEEQANSLSDEEAIQYIFAPGLSTAETISDVSGRGVGMDVVRNSVERLGGTFKLTSQRGKGTNLKLHLPLSMAVTQVMAVLVDGRLIGIPIEAVLETVRLPVERIHVIKNSETFLLRERIIPLLRLREILELEPCVADNAELAVLVVSLNGEPVGLVVDQFREGVEILLKPLEGILSTLSSYSGSALMGDGSIMLVLNLKELL